MHSNSSQPRPGISLRNRLVSKYAMVPPVSGVIAYSSQQEKDHSVGAITESEKELATAVAPDTIRVLGSFPSRSAGPPHFDTGDPPVGDQQAQEWHSVLLNAPNTLEQDLIPNQDLSWMEGPNLVFFPGLYHGQTDPHTGLFNT